MSIKPKDVLPDEQNEACIEGVTVRKGTVAAVLANLDLLDSPHTSPEAKAAALETIREFVPALVALGFRKHLRFNDPRVQAMLDQLL